MDERDQLGEAAAWVMKELRFEQMLARLHDRVEPTAGERDDRDDRDEVRRPA